MSWPADWNTSWAGFLRAGDRGPRKESAAFAVLAAHPDDETIGASVVLTSGSPALVIYLTDGAPRDRRFWSPQAQGSRADYAELRRSEARRALALAGISEARIFWLGGIDQEAIVEASLLAARLSEWLRTRAIAALITHAYEGGHPDHDAAALVARMALSLSSSRAQLLEMTSYHARDGRCVTGEFLQVFAARNEREMRFELSSDERRRKREMLGQYRSQSLVLENFPVDEERVREAPAYDFCRAPHAGKLWYECMGWPLSGAEWRQLARQALEKNAEVRCG